MGNLLLLMSTMWFIFISLWNAMLTIRLPEFYDMATWLRTVPWVFAIIGLFYWVAGVIFELVKLSYGNSWLDTVEETFFAYVLWINMPTAIIELYYVSILMKYTDDIIEL